MFWKVKIAQKPKQQLSPEAAECFDIWMAEIDVVRGQRIIQESKNNGKTTGKQ